MRQLVFPFTTVSLALLCLLTSCRTPKGLLPEFSSVEKIPVIEHLGHLWRASGHSALKAPVSATKAAVSVIAQRGHAFFAGATPLPTLETLPPGTAAPGTEGFEQYLDQMALPPRTLGKMELLVDGPEYFPALIHAVKQARQSIDCQVFIFDNDDTGVRFAGLLKQRSKEVPVRVILDGLGTRTAHKMPPETPPPTGFNAPDFMGRYLKQDSQIKVRVTTNPALLCDHTKLQIIDGVTAFLGGMNIGREYESEWHDLMARVEGPVISDLARGFRRHWNEEDWVRNWTLQNALDQDKSTTAPPQVSGGYPMRVLRTDLVKGRKEIVTAFRAATQAAKKRVWVHTPYLAEEGMISDFMDAAQRGIDVRVVIPSRNDSGLMQSVNHTAASRLIASGVKVLVYPGMSHMKVALCDDWAMFGSANCDTLSLKLNRELNLASSAPPFVRAIERRVFLADFSRCSRLSLQKAEKKSSSLMGILGNQL